MRKKKSYVFHKHRYVKVQGRFGFLLLDFFVLATLFLFFKILWWDTKKISLYRHCTEQEILSIDQLHQQNVFNKVFCVHSYTECLMTRRPEFMLKVRETLTVACLEHVKTHIHGSIYTVSSYFPSKKL